MSGGASAGGGLHFILSGAPVLFKKRMVLPGLHFTGLGAGEHPWLIVTSIMIGFRLGIASFRGVKDYLFIDKRRKTTDCSDQFNLPTWRC